MEDSKFDKLGGRIIIEKVATTFYDKVYDHQWLGQFFKEVLIPITI